MAKTKREAAELESLRRQLRLAKAFAWPAYPKPEQIDVARAIEGKEWPAKIEGWYCHSWDLESRISKGWSRSGSHSNTLAADHGCQGAGRMYATRLEALLMARHEITERAAEALANLDAAIEAERAEPSE